jgi:hypothetical protein
MIMEFTLSSTASRLSTVAMNADIEDSTTVKETPPSQAGIVRRYPINDFLENSDNDIPDIGTALPVPIPSVGVMDSSGDMFNNNAPVSDAMDDESVEYEGMNL